MILIETLVLIADLAIVYYVALEYYESRRTNEALLKIMNKQRRQKKKVSVDRIIKAVTQGEPQ